MTAIHFYLLLKDFRVKKFKSLSHSDKNAIKILMKQWIKKKNKAHVFYFNFNVFYEFRSIIE